MDPIAHPNWTAAEVYRIVGPDHSQLLQAFVDALNHKRRDERSMCEPLAGDDTRDLTLAQVFKPPVTFAGHKRGREPLEHVSV